MCLNAYYKNSSKNEALLELIAPAMTEKINVKVEKSSIQFSQNRSILRFE